MAGRPTDCTPDIADAVAQHIIDGLSNRDAAALAGISESAFYEWLKRGREELERRESPRVKPGSKQWEREQPFVEFAEQVKKAIPQRKLKHLGNINKAATDGTWQASAWLLERLHPDEFSKRVDITTQGEKIKGYAVISPDDWDDDGGDAD